MITHRPDPRPGQIVPPSVAPPRAQLDPTLPPPLADLHSRISQRTATVAVVGMGYVGLPLLLAAAAEGFPVIGVDTDPSKVESLRSSRSYVVDVSDDEIPTGDGVLFTTDSLALRDADVVIIAVPTPLREGSPDLSLVQSAASDVALVLRAGQLVVLESTTYPGTTEDLVLPLLEKSGLVAGEDFALAYSPERINPGSGWSFRATPKIVAGLGPADAELAICLYGAMVDHVVPTASLKAAEMAKLVENTFRQVNIALVNELATIAPAIGVDLWDALDAAATKPFGYMPFWPGPGVGGHCIAIDPSYLSWKVEQRLGFGIGFIEHARSVNNRMPAFVTSRISEALNRIGRPLQGARVLVLGLTYKPGVNDVRESPALNVLGRLLDAGAVCSYHDPYVPSIDVGGRRQGDVPRVRVPEERPHLTSVELTEEVLVAADCIVILTPHPGIDYDAAISAGPLVFDAVGVTRDRRNPHVVLL